jgi:predicted nuclease with TOPRIM domain
MPEAVVPIIATSKRTRLQESERAKRYREKKQQLFEAMRDENDDLRRLLGEASKHVRRLEAEIARLELEHAAKDESVRRVSRENDRLAAELLASRRVENAAVPDDAWSIFVD